MADKSSTVELAGVPFGALACDGTEKEWEFTVAVGRINAYVQVYALDSGTGLAAQFQWTNAAGGTYNILPVGAYLTLPVRSVQSYFFKRGGVSNVDLYGSCVG